MTNTKDQGIEGSNHKQNENENSEWLKEQLTRLDDNEVLAVIQGVETLVQLLSIHDAYFGKTLTQVLMKISLVMNRYFAEMGDNDEGEFLENYTCVMELLQELATRTGELDVSTLKAAGRKFGIEGY